MLPFCRWLEQSSVGANVRESLWLFPAIETLHLLGMAALVGTTAVFDLRLLGWMLRRERVSELAGRLLPWSWVGFAVQVVTGALLFTSEAVKVYTNPAFRVKMLLIFLAGVHALIFHWSVYRDVASWDDSGVLPVGAKVAGFVSILLWIGIVAAGRFIGFVLFCCFGIADRPPGELTGGDGQSSALRTGHAASGISSNLNGRTSKFGWLQAPATMGARGKCPFYP